MRTLHYSQSAVEAVVSSRRDLIMIRMRAFIRLKFIMRSFMSAFFLSKVKGNYSSWILLKNRLRLIVQTIIAHSYSVLCVIPRLGFEDNRICEPIILEIDHEKA